MSPYPDMNISFSVQYSEYDLHDELDIALHLFAVVWIKIKNRARMLAAYLAGRE